jgi:cellobiose phosphorylase
VIDVTNSGARGARGSLVVDGVAIDGNTVPYAPAGSTVRVEVTL